ncbi:cytochrome P450 [Desarmillaria tabescens]|uniref:Cytochrome P450 n=1 Tax=Armillaria tabescens TaxID=1929756 RepID=A0AA39NQB9_ARMTA|nr:cytochrome P450 [Desarmillaria tabescens]KAK0469876.1 cytochrome P450 [Desarmillaria tabescens]
MTVTEWTTSFYIFALFLWVVLRLKRIGSREPGLPPGPPTVPLLGNLHIFPAEYAHYRFTDWARIYGDIYSLKVGPGTVIVITSAAAVKELMDKRSASTADRPPNHMADVVAGGSNMVLSRYSDVWRVLRKNAHAVLTPKASLEHVPIQSAEATQLMYDILQTPEAFYTHVRRYSSSTILSITYGKRCLRYESPEATLFFKAQHLWELVLEPGAHPPVDLLPFLQHLPGAWKSLCKEARRLQRQLYFGLLDECQARLQHGQENGCFMEKVLQNQELLGLNRELAGYLGGVLIEGGSDTTSSFLQSLILALVAFPEAQRKAQEEMNKVVGDQRLPTLDDFADLPYIQAIIKEVCLPSKLPTGRFPHVPFLWQTHRFRPVAPVAIPHGMLAAEEYRGYMIPKGATIFVNTWGIFHNPDVYDEPEVFNPDRYLLTEHGTKPGVDDSHFRSTLVFGSGRRICPGMHLANHSLMINTMNLIWAFQFSPTKDPVTSATLPVDIFAYEKGILTAPRPFQCHIAPRSEGKVNLIKRAFLDAEDVFVKFESGITAEDKEWVEKYRARVM